MEWETAPLLYYTKKVIRQTCYTNCDIIITSSENLFVEKFGNYKLIYLSHNACFKCLIDRKEWWIDMKNIQISEELFVVIMRYFMLEQEELLPQIKQGLEKKLDAMVMRELYTKYKTALTEEEKEKARKEYLDRRGVPESIRW